LRIATWNVNSIGARIPRVLEWLDLVGPDVLCLQETKCAADAFPSEGVEERGYEIAAVGDGRWNGVAILSRVGLSDVQTAFAEQPGYANEEEDALLAVPVVESRAVGATCGGLRIWSLYVPNGRTVDHGHYAYKLQWLQALRGATPRRSRRGPSS
jgi:exodeoxyribonuclease-3